MSKLIESARHHSVVEEDRHTLALDIRGLPGVLGAFLVDISSGLQLHHRMGQRQDTVSPTNDTTQGLRCSHNDERVIESTA